MEAALADLLEGSRGCSSTHNCTNATKVLMLRYKSSSNPSDKCYVGAHSCQGCVPA